MAHAWTDRLSEYLDGELDGSERAGMEAHLSTCAACRNTLDELRIIVDQAAALGTRAPETDLWPGILNRIGPDGATVVPFPRATAHAPARPRRRFTFSMPQLAAAATILMILSGGAVWLTLRPSEGGPTPMPTLSAVEGAPVEGGAPRLVSNVEENYDDAIRQLEDALAANRNRLDPATVTVIERNLEIIDAAIADAREALINDPNDVDLYHYLDATLMKKIDLLRRAARLARAQT